MARGAGGKENDMAQIITKEQEYEALEKVRAIVDALGADSYVGRAFEGVFDIAERNIDEDAWFNPLEKVTLLREQIAAPLTEAIEAAEGRATARTITAWEVVVALREVEERLSISKKAMDGVEVSIDINAQDFPRAYKWPPESTHFDAMYKGGYWRVTNVYRYKTQTPRFRHIVRLTEEAKRAVISRHSCWD